MSDDILRAALDEEPFKNFDYTQFVRVEYSVKTQFGEHIGYWSDPWTSLHISPKNSPFSGCISFRPDQMIEAHELMRLLRKTYRQGRVDKGRELKAVLSNLDKPYALYPHIAND
ncbi:hypothetical protein [uncultured Roseibium sp.]|uniref:hypothetical protein n=1 Tax=uncultured Roseibium sp. TaxID=1936171 RepID=UPI002616B311|nr:hypothetical protein [uncultured Roseibium sp.]